MRTLGVLQARMTSSRLPGKVLEPVEGVPMIARQLERLGRARGIDELVVATSIDSSDDVLVDFLERRGIPLVRGFLDDVLGRFVTVMDTYHPQTVVRLTADCPLASPALIDRVISEYYSANVDYASNTLHPTYPDGLDVEVVKPEALRWIASNSADSAEHEHVTLGVYRRPDRFRLLNVAGEVDLSALRWTVDNADDLTFVRTIYERLYPVNPAFEMSDVLRLLEKEPGLSRTSTNASRNAALDGLDTGAMEHY